ncbi:hypothetical protein FHT12_000358 [Xanthomonas campestris]|nr:hypothetical protein [Xanthomonas euroxanthea]
MAELTRVLLQYGRLTVDALHGAVLRMWLPRLELRTVTWPLGELPLT